MARLAGSLSWQCLLTQMLIVCLYYFAVKADAPISFAKELTGLKVPRALVMMTMAWQQQWPQAQPEQAAMRSFANV